MIRIHKPKPGPAILCDPKAKGCHETQKLIQAYKAGERSFEFSREIYGDHSVKEALKKAQKDKCCFCESKVTHISSGDVEHFRPKQDSPKNPVSP